MFYDSEGAEPGDYSHLDRVSVNYANPEDLGLPSESKERLMRLLALLGCNDARELDADNLGALEDKIDTALQKAPRSRARGA